MMTNKKSADYYLKKSHRELKKAYESAERNDRLKMLAQCAGSLQYALTALVMQLQEMSENKPGGPGGSAAARGAS
jgi:hypothetical protein